MYLAQEKINGKTHYIIRQSYPSAGHYKCRDLFDMGTDPRHFINYPGGNSYYFDPLIEASLDDQGVACGPDELDQLLFDFLDPEIQRVITGFDRGRRKKAKTVESSETKIQSSPHLFDRRRFHYLRFGHSSQRHIDRVPDKLFWPLLQKSRDELEHYFEAEERRLAYNEFGAYVATIFQLSCFVPSTGSEHSLVRQMDSYFTDRLCRLNRDADFLAGVAKPGGLFAPLIKYAIFYFDFAPSRHHLEQQYIRDFINRHRAYRPPAGTKIKIKEAEKLFGHDWKALKGMNRSTLTRIFRKLALKHHPDQGGDAESFRRLTHYYNLLMDKKPEG